MSKKEKYPRGGHGVKDNQGKMTRKGTPKTIDNSGYCDGGGSAELAKAASSINTGNRKGGAAGL